MSCLRSYSCYLVGLEIRLRYLALKSGSKIWSPSSGSVSYTVLTLHPNSPTQKPSHSIISLNVVMIQSLSCIQLFVIPWTAAHQASPSFTISWNHWCYPIMASSVITFFCLQSFPESESFPVSQFFASSGQIIEASSLASLFPMNIKGWFPLGLTGLVSLQSKGLSRIFCSTTVEKHKFFSYEPCLWSNSHLHPWLLEKP